MPLTNAQRQKRWRDKRNGLARTFTGSPRKLAKTIETECGIAYARKVARAIRRRTKAEP